MNTLKDDKEKSIPTSHRLNYHNDKEYNDDEMVADGTTEETTHAPKERRDEVVEVRKMSSMDTDRLRLWRIVVAGVLFWTAFAVTFTTYFLLKQQESKNFKIAVRGFFGFGIIWSSY